MQSRWFIFKRIRLSTLKDSDVIYGGETEHEQETEMGRTAGRRDPGDRMSIFLSHEDLCEGEMRRVAHTQELTLLLSVVLHWEERIGPDSRTGILILGQCQLWVPFNLGWVGNWAEILSENPWWEWWWWQEWAGNYCPGMWSLWAALALVGRISNTLLFSQDHAGAAQCGAGGGPHCREENVPLCQADWLCPGLDGGWGWTSCLQVRCGQNCLFVEIFLLHELCSPGDV